MQKKYVMLVDTARCVNCKACEVSCRAEWSTPLGYSRNWVSEVLTVSKDGIPGVSLLPGRCMHCDSPPCVTACPTGASYKRDDGIVLVDRDLCTGCGICIDPCPYDARFLEPTVGMISKCTFCQPRIDVGEEPACVHVCFTRALMFGDANDPASEVARRLADGSWKRLVTAEVDVGPNVYYSKDTLFDASVLPRKKAPAIKPRMLFTGKSGMQVGLGGLLGLFGAAGVLKLVKRKEEVARHQE
jgi:tetrathionate reductase subunit B